MLWGWNNPWKTKSNGTESKLEFPGLAHVTKQGQILEEQSVAMWKVLSTWKSASQLCSLASWIPACPGWESLLPPALPFHMVHPLPHKHLQHRAQPRLAKAPGKLEIAAVMRGKEQRQWHLCSGALRSNTAVCRESLKRKKPKIKQNKRQMLSVQRHHLRKHTAQDPRNSCETALQGFEDVPTTWQTHISAKARRALQLSLYL